MTFKIVRTKRKTICVSVSAENEITVRCPLKTSDKRVEEFVESKLEWIKKIVEENGKKLSANSEITSYNKIYVNGIKCALNFSDKNVITSDAVYVTGLKKIKPLFISTFSEEFIEYAKILARQFSFRVGSFRVKAYKSRWGCCDKNGNITFNYLLFMLPPSLQRYVVIHELCHTVYFNHSPDFWSFVAQFEPDCKYLRKQLKSFDFIINLY